MVHSRHHIDTYSAEDVSRLCKIGGLKPADPSKFREELEQIAAIYRREHSRRANLPRNKDVAHDLKGIVKRTNQLVEALENLPDASMRALLREHDRRQHSDVILGIKHELPHDVPSLTIPLSKPDEEFEAVNLQLSEVKNIILGLENIAQTAAETLPKRRSGKLRDLGLRLWMSNIHLLWKRTTDEPFTRDVTPAGAPVNAAARFCTSAFRHIDTRTPETLILNEMRYSIRDRKKRNM